MTKVFKSQLLADHHPDTWQPDSSLSAVLLDFDTSSVVRKDVSPFLNTFEQFSPFSCSILTAIGLRDEGSVVDDSLTKICEMTAIPSIS